ncbi:MAG TPA: hypothetical protein DCY91_16010 [Cyanobacteria bacterium UBA11370]|nr:hypothetical protein [Cyanobacteria bacterium UBA11370]HBY78762.1 hypothetical protein [Cyanobacteria bacterium UBA11148]
MQLPRESSVIFLTTTALLTLTSQSSFAFSITPNQPGADTYIPTEEYILPPDRQGITFLSPPSVTKIERDSDLTKKLDNLLKAAFGATGTIDTGWSFTFAPNDLEGSFHITEYVAVGKPTQVGANFRIEYRPIGGDPKPANKELHWIQRVVNNHNITDNPGHGNQEDVIDRKSNVKSPFYDVSWAWPEGIFGDRPRRESENNHNWLGEVYLAELTAPKTVTIYNGVQWGWKNRVSCPMPKNPPKLQGRDGTAPGETEPVPGDSTELPVECQTVPEPSSILGILITGALALLGIRKQHDYR